MESTYHYHVDTTSQEVFDRDNHKCLFCDTITMLHDGRIKYVVSLKNGGTHAYENAVWCCNTCYPLIKGSTLYNQKAILYLHSLGLFSQYLDRLVSQGEETC